MYQGSARAQAVKATSWNRRWFMRFLLLAGVIFVLPLLITNNYSLGVLINIGIYAIVVIGLCLLSGYTGQVSLGHAAFYGLGAYLSAILTTRVGIPPLAALPLAALVTGLIALAVGVPVLKLREHYLALGTLGLGIIVFIVFQEARGLTGGPSGLGNIPRVVIAGYVFKTDRQFYYLAWSMALLALLFAHNLVHSRIGRALKAINSSEVAASHLRIHTARLKLQIFVLSAMYASVAGSLYAHWVTFVSPAPFGYLTSVSFLVMAAVGGLSNIWGSLFGTSILVLLAEVLRDAVPRVMGHAGGEYEAVLFGLILVLVMIYMPGGITSSLQRGLERLLELRSGATGRRDGNAARRPAA